MNHVDLYTGIGGFSLAAEWAGFETVAHAETDTEASIVLKAFWPAVPNVGNIKHVRWDRLRRAHGAIDLLTGGVPCQPASLLGDRMGSADERWLWPETLAIVRILRPRACVFENPPAILSLESGRAFSGILGGLAAIGYDVLWGSVFAAALDAGHERERIAIVATDAHDARLEGYARDGLQQGCTERKGEGRPTAAQDLRGRVFATEEGAPQWWHETHTGIPVLADGIPTRLAEAFARCTGNAIVPQAFYPILSALHGMMS